MKKIVAILLAAAMLLSLAACGGSSEKAPQGEAAANEETGLKHFRMGYFDEGQQDGTSAPLRNNLVAAIEAVGAEGVPVQPAGGTTDDFLDALDVMLSKGVDAVAIPWVNFMFAGTPAAVKKCEDAGVYYGFYYSIEVEGLGEDTLNLCKDSPRFLGCFYQTDNDAAYQAMKTLHENGCDKLGYIGLPADNELRENSRDYGVKMACEEFGMTILAEQRDIAVTTTAEGGATTVENFSAAYPEMQGIIIAGMTQYVMPGVDQAITSKGLEGFKVGAIDFPDNMKAYSDDGVLVYAAGAHITGPVYLTILAANAINGTPLIEKGQSFNQQYVKLTSSEDISKFMEIANDVVYNADEVRHCLKVLNPEFTLEEFNNMILSYSYADIVARHHS